MHLLAIDTETLALGAGRDRIVQFCALELDRDLAIRSQWTQFIHPGRPIPPQATAIHGITDDMVATAPPFAQVAQRLRALIQPHTVFVAYNAGFDLGVLNLEFMRAGVPIIPPSQPVLDPLQVERKVTSRSLGPTYARYMGRPLDNAHRADADTYAMVEVLRAQRRVHKDQLPDELEDLVAWPTQRRGGRRLGSHFYRDEDGEVRLAFGRHKDKRASEVPEYLQWMLEEDFPDATKRRVRSLLGDQRLPLMPA